MQDIVMDRLLSCKGDCCLVHQVLDTLGDVGSFTLEEIGQVLGLTRERVRQIEQKAMQKLRHPRVGRHLKAYLEAHASDESRYNYGAKIQGDI